MLRRPPPILNLAMVLVASGCAPEPLGPRIAPSEVVAAVEVGQPFVSNGPRDFGTYIGCHVRVDMHSTRIDTLQIVGWASRHLIPSIGGDSVRSQRFTTEEFNALFGDIPLPPGATRSVSWALRERRPFDFEVEVFYRSTRGARTYSEVVSGRCGSQIDPHAPPPELTVVGLTRKSALDHDTVTVNYRVQAGGGLFSVMEWPDPWTLVMLGANWLGNSYLTNLPETPSAFERSVRVLVPHGAGANLSLRMGLYDVFDRGGQFRVDLAEP